MDYLTYEDKASIGEVVSKVSFIGIAKVDKDYKILWTNEQFSKILGVVRGEILDVKFSDITLEPERSQDIVQAKLVKEGRINSYMMSKDIQLKDGRVVKTEVIVNGVRCKKSGDFLHFILQSMPREERLDADTSSQLVSKESVSKKKSPKVWLTTIAVIVTLVIEKFLTKN